MLPDHHLLEQYAASGDQAAFAQLVRRHLDLVYAAALRTVGGDAHAARDVSQGAFLALAAKAGKLRDRRTLAGWLYVTSRKLGAQHVRADRRRQARHEAAHAMNAATPSRDSDFAAVQPLLEQGLDRLGEIDRAVVVERCVEHQPFAAIGRSHGISEDAARMRVDRALEKLQTFLARRGVTSTAAALAVGLEAYAAPAPAGLAATISGSVGRAAVPAAKSVAWLQAVVIASLAVSGTCLVLAVRPHRPMALTASLRDGSPRVGSSGKAPAPRPTAAARREGPATSSQSPKDESAKTAAAESRADQLRRSLAFYQPLLERLHLTPEQESQFQAMLTKRLSDGLDFTTVAKSMHLKPDDPDLKQLRAEADAALAKQVGTAFGDGAAAALATYHDTGALRELTFTLGKMLATSATPLTSDQSEQLVEIMAQNQTLAGAGHSTPKTINLDAVLAQAQQILTPAQLVAFRQAQLTWH